MGIKELLASLPETKSTLPEIDYRIAERAKYWLKVQHGIYSTIWRLNDGSWGLQCDDYPHSHFMMVKIYRTYQLFEALEIEPLPPGKP